MSTQRSSQESYFEYDDVGILPSEIPGGQNNALQLPVSSGGQPSAPGSDVMPMPAQSNLAQQYELLATPQAPMQMRVPVQATGSVESVNDKTSSHMLGLSVVLAGAGAAAGYQQGGAFGAFSGSLFGGALVNAYRAYKFYMDGSDDGQKEALVSATYALAALAGGGFLWYKFVYDKEKKVFNANGEVETEEEPEEEDCGCSKTMKNNPCDIRKAI